MVLIKTGKSTTTTKTNATWYAHLPLYPVNKLSILIKMQVTKKLHYIVHLAHYQVVKISRALKLNNDQH